MIGALSHNIVAKDELQSCERERMYHIFEENYDYVNRDCFEEDLSKKDFIVLLRDDMELIQGFSTFALNPADTGTDDFSIIFSGDTVIAPRYWGTQELVRAFGKAVGSVYAGLEKKKLYWFLLSKGHRTYLYLPLFFKSYYPSPSGGDESLIPLIDHCSRRLYPEGWSPETGTIRFSRQIGQLKPELAEGTWRRGHTMHVRYFLERNPEFSEGTELACMAEITPENMKPRGRELVLAGMREPILKLHTKEI